DAAADPDRALGQNERRLEGREDATSHDASVRLVDVVEQDGELVATESGGGVVGADRGEQPLCDHRERGVCVDMAEGLVDRLEVIEVDEQDPGSARVPTAPAKGVFEPVDEQRAVRETGQ